MVTCDNKESSKEIKLYGECERQNNAPLKDVTMLPYAPKGTMQV